VGEEVGFTMSDPNGDPKGKFESVKNRLNDYVTAAIGGHVSNDWRINIKELGTFPISTLRFGVVSLLNENYGGLTPESGCWAEYEFSIFIQDKEYSDQLDTVLKHYSVMDDASDVVDYLIGKSGDSTEISSYGIYEIGELRIEYNQFRRGGRNVGRAIVRGKIRSKWLD